MTAQARRVASAGTIALAIAIGCNSPERQAAEAARNSSELAVTAEQKQLWQDAANRGDAPGLERVPVLQDPVAQRAPSQAPAVPSKPAPPPQPTIPQGVRNEIRVVVYPNDPFATYTGPAKVEDVDKSGERIQLALPGKLGMLTLLVRIDTKPLPVMVGDMVDVSYRARQNPRVPNDAIAIRAAGGAGIAHVMNGGNGPVQNVSIPLFNLNVEQRDEAGLPVRISGPNVPKPIDLAVNQIDSVGGGIMVRVLGSAGVQKGTNVGLIEGAPFTLNVMIWRVP